MNQNKTGNIFRCIGVMSGTSLDGVDVVAVCFSKKDQWEFKIDACKTYDYTIDILKQLKKSPHLSGLELAQLDVDYGKYLGGLVKSFASKLSYKPDFVASHGYTVFHEPAKGLTLQIGSGAQIAAVSGLTTICDFRTLDVAMGGQGAPLVPIGDELLFGDYTACLNLGGFSNISFHQNNKRIAFDICPVNFVLNHFMQKIGEDYDNGGALARVGNLDLQLLSQLNSLSYYRQNPPKSLGREFVENQILTLIPQELEMQDVLSTFCEHVAIQITNITNNLSNGQILVTGGGSHNTYLMERVSAFSKNEIVIPNHETVDFKEAIIFAFLGLLRTQGENNCLASVTGARIDNCGGAIYRCC